jgi:SWI/SNF-related matrix-associated actin-dependent regulator of chromatin subfamily A3
VAPEVSLEEILKSSDAIEFRKGGDAIKALAMGEEQLSKMPQAEQPKQLKSTLLPYQLQVSLECSYFFLPLFPASRS